MLNDQTGYSTLLKALERCLTKIETSAIAFNMLLQHFSTTIGQQNVLYRVEPYVTSLSLTLGHE